MLLLVMLLRGLLFGLPRLQVRADVDELLKSEGLVAHSDDDRLLHFLSIYQSTKVCRFIYHFQCFRHALVQNVALKFVV